MRRRKLWIVLTVLLVAAAIAGLIYLRSRAAPEAARLLPDSDAVLYINLRLIRLAHVFGEAGPISHDPEYEQFVNETGFQFERDLDQAAFAVHAPTSVPASADLGFSENARYTEVFVGKFDFKRASAYFQKLATGTEAYRDATIYAIPHEGRTVRVAMLGLDTVAVSNAQDLAPVHQIIDKYRAAAWAASGPALVRDHHRQVPLGSFAWAVAKIPGREATASRSALPGILAMPALAGATLVASARYLGTVHLRVDALTASENDAHQLLETAKAFSALLQGAAASTTQGGADADVKALLESIKVEERGTRVSLTATVPAGFIKKALSPPPSEPPSPQPAPPAAPPKHGKKKR
jgi:hypothetical protein